MRGQVDEWAGTEVMFIGSGAAGGRGGDDGGCD